MRQNCCENDLKIVTKLSFNCCKNKFYCYVTFIRTREVNVEFICVDDNNEGQLTQDDLQALNDAANGIQRAQRITGKQKFRVRLVLVRIS
jgi:hypothetical protein